MYTILHLSDLHRSKSDPISNDELLSCLLADARRFITESPPIHKPDAIVVSGDLVQGVKIGTANYAAEMRRQYTEAYEFLCELAGQVTDGDRSRVIIIPGNHDVDWNIAHNAMVEVATAGQDVPSLLRLPNSPYRWCWKALRCYRVHDEAIYQNRFQYFCDMYLRFYDSADLSVAVDPARSWNIFPLDNGRIAVGAFNSCANNDCFNFAGHIPAQAISQSHLELLRSRTVPLLWVAVWHHDVEGPPQRSDYMDSALVRMMIDKGFRLGLHGHHHRSEAARHSLHVSGEQQMAVVSAGSLCAGAEDLPTGFARQYNVIEIADDYACGRIHVREMTVPGVFAPGRLISLGGPSFADLRWTQTPGDELVNSGRGGGHVLGIVEEAERLISNGNYDDAQTLLAAHRGRLGTFARKLIIEALYKAERWEDLMREIGEPQSADELTRFVRGAAARRAWHLADGAIRNAVAAGYATAMLDRDLTAWLAVQRRIHP